MFEEAGAWFWTHVVAALLIIWGDSNGTLEPAVDRFEKMLGVYQEPPDTMEYEEPPYYVPPMDSTWILPDNLKRENNE